MSHRILLAAGAESLDGRALPPLPGPDAPLVCAAGRELQSAIPAVPTVVVPMTLGRQSDLPGVAAQSLRWAARGRRRGDLLLARPLADSGHLVGWLRGAVGRALASGSAARTAVLLVAPAMGPEPDAELFRVARLVWQYSPVRWVEVALSGGEPDVDEGIERCRLVGAEEVVLVPASFVPAPVRPGARTAGPLLSPASLSTLIHRRAAEAEHRWYGHGDDGLAETIPHDHTHDHEDRPKETRIHVG
ncbi:sirohydrochlorin chelatase [Nonomuraea sp. NPDC050663]|uniref:sirohydrochlorin chelatase n=1 Tax=Nonomuraea sp. NPDC050663 TaxID=3364370 RepID=UPI0037B763C1